MSSGSDIFRRHYKTLTIDIPLPKNFGGISGGGLWQILLKDSSVDKFEPTCYILSGLAFYQSELKANKRLIRCHGRQSIYKNVYEFIKDKSS